MLKESLAAKGRGRNRVRFCSKIKLMEYLMGRVRRAFACRAMGFACALSLSATAGASVYPLPPDGSPVVGTDEAVTAVYQDTLPDLAHKYSLGYYEIIRANPGVDVWLPGAGEQGALPGGRILPPAPH